MQISFKKLLTSVWICSILQEFLRTDEEGAEQSMYQYGFYGAAGLRIAGGTDEILKNIISEQVLGMPQDMRADKGLPFNEIPTGNK